MVGRVEIPHQDGMLPLVSTFPLHNIRFLLSEPVYRQQHVCSNIITAEERAPLLDEGFLGKTNTLVCVCGGGETRYHNCVLAGFT